MLSVHPFSPGRQAHARNTSALQDTFTSLHAFIRRFLFGLYLIFFPPSFSCRTHYDANPDDAEEPSDSVDMPEKRGRRGCSLVENCRDKALLNIPPSWEKPCWASVAVGSAAAHAGPAGPLPAALTARDAIDDLPLHVLPGASHSVVLRFGFEFIFGMTALAAREAAGRRWRRAR